MIICPLCEHIQERGVSCDVCGKIFAPSSTLDFPVQSLPGLDTGRQGDVSLVGRDLEDTIAIDDDEPFTPGMSLEEMAARLFPEETEEKPTTRCRSCGTVQPAGEVSCIKCGSRLPRFLDESPKASGNGNDGPSAIRCRQCGAYSVPGENGICRSCGTRMVAKDD